MAVHEDFTGPRFRTLVPVETAVSDIDPGEALRRAGRQLSTDWRPEAREWYARINALISDRIRAQYAAEDRQFLASWGARFETGDAREADQFQAWLEHAVRAGTVEAQLALIDALESPEWLKRYAAYVRRYRVSTADRLAWFEASELPRPDDSDRPRRFVDTGTFFYEIPREG